MTEAVVALVLASGMTAAVCASLGVSRATVRRRRARLSAPEPAPAKAGGDRAPLAEIGPGVDGAATVGRVGFVARATFR